MNTANMVGLYLDDGLNPAVRSSLIYMIGMNLLFLVTGLEVLETDIEDKPEEVWQHNVHPEMDMILAKLVRYSSNIFAVAYAYPETALDSNMDYDYRQYLTFLSLFAEKIGSNILECAENNLRIIGVN